MARKPRTPRKAIVPRWYRGADIPLRIIRRFARQVAERFQPDKIILFGSYAYGTPHADSDVDILVVMPARNQIDQAVRIDCDRPALPSRSHRPHPEEHEMALGRRRVVSTRDHVEGESPL
jgi:hypothetical protein